MLVGFKHLVWTPIGWIEASVAVVFRPYRVLGPNTGSESPQRRLPVWGVRAAVSAITGKNSKEDHCRPTYITWYMSHMDGSDLMQRYRQIFSLPPPLDQSHMW